MLQVHMTLPCLAMHLRFEPDLESSGTHLPSAASHNLQSGLSHLNQMLSLTFAGRCHHQGIEAIHVRHPSRNIHNLARSSSATAATTMRLPRLRQSTRATPLSGLKMEDAEEQFANVKFSCSGAGKGEYELMNSFSRSRFGRQPFGSFTRMCWPA